MDLATIPTEPPPVVSEVSAKFCGKRVSCGQCNGSPRKYSWFSRPEPLLFLLSSSSIVFTRLSGPRSVKKPGSAGNRTRDPWICSREFDHQTTEAIEINMIQYRMSYNRTHKFSIISMQDNEF
jgi:hypothetical protein